MAVPLKIVATLLMMLSGGSFCAMVLSNEQDERYLGLFGFLAFGAMAALTIWGGTR